MNFVEGDTCTYLQGDNNVHRLILDPKNINVAMLRLKKTLHVCKTENNFKTTKREIRKDYPLWRAVKRRD